MFELAVIDPANGETLGRLPCSDAEALVATARAAHRGWERTSAAERAALLKAGARRLRVAADDLACCRLGKEASRWPTRGAGSTRASVPSSSTPDSDRSTAVARCKDRGGRPT